MTAPAGPPPAGRGHYSIAHYANVDVAEAFDALRFGGPVGQFLLESQQRLLDEMLAPAPGRHIVDVGTGTGRAALALAAGGARVTGVDFSAEMLGVAHRRAVAAGLAVGFVRADAHHLPLDDRVADATVCLRLLMHVPDWRACVGELCRVTRHRVVVDFPARCSAAALESGGRWLRQRLGGTTEAYRVIAEADMRGTLAAHGFRVTAVRRQFVLPIAVHKRLGVFGITRRVETLLAGIGLLRIFGSPVTMVAER